MQENEEFYCSSLRWTWKANEAWKVAFLLTFHTVLVSLLPHSKEKKLSNQQETETNYRKPQFWF